LYFCRLFKLKANSQKLTANSLCLSHLSKLNKQTIYNEETIILEHRFDVFQYGGGAERSAAL
jgi:hypothetical protein